MALVKRELLTSLGSSLRCSLAIFLSASAAAVLGVLLRGVPLALVATSAAEDLLRAGQAAHGDGRCVGMNPLRWSRQELQIIMGSGPTWAVFTSLHPLLVSKSHFVDMAVPVFLAFGAATAATRRSKCRRHAGTISGLVIAVVVIAAVRIIGHALPLAAGRPASKNELMLVRLGTLFLAWVPVGTLAYRPIVPSERAGWMGWRVAMMFAACAGLYWVFCKTSGLYFQGFGGSLGRAALGGICPHVWGIVCSAFFYGPVMGIAESGSMRAAVLLMAVPVCFYCTTLANMTVGAPDLATGIAVELGSFAIEVMSRATMLLGLSPIDVLLVMVKPLGRAAVFVRFHVFGHGSSRVSPMFNNVVSNQPVGGQQAGEVALPGVEEGGEDASSGDAIGGGLTTKTALLSQLVVCANATEVVCHVVVGAMYVLEKANLTKAAAPPLPSARVVGLVCIKLVTELFTDCVVALLFALAQMAGRPSLAAAWRQVDKWLLALILSQAVGLAFTVHEGMLRDICAVPVPGTSPPKLLSISPCPLKPR